MSERAENLGRRVELRQQRQRLEAEVVALRDRLRRLLPVDADPTELKGEEVLQAAIALHTSLDELGGVARRIDILNRELGG
ncbi:MAG TPA: hypothetical protein VE028_01585 [Nitratidesulfovibrio sp.]|nr:hypothetical protein [Nitratidesulfovibrio sp.]